MADKLSLVASKGQIDKVQELLQSGAKFDTDQEGRTALHYAALNGYTDVCRVLIVHGCSLDHQDVVGFTALHRACSQGHVEVCKVLLEAGCALDCQDEHGNTALHEAAWNGFSKTLEILIKFNYDVSIVNKSGFTALHLAAQNGHNESSRVLIYAGCSTDTKNNYGDTALHTAARYGHAGVTRIFISARCALNEQNKNGDTPLHISAALKRRKITKLLVEAGIDPYLCNKQNETAVDVARRKEYSEVVHLITTHTKRKSYCQPSVNVSPERPTVSFEGKKLASSCEAKPAKEKRFFFFKRKKKNKEIPNPPQVTSHVPLQTVRGTERQMGRSEPVQGFFNKYVPKDGVQYYKDLAGNIKQGPIGYTPICQCIPVVKRLEKNLDETCENIYEHIDASHQILQNRINQLDKRTSQQQGFAFDRMTNERHHATHNKCRLQSDGRFPREPRAEHSYSKYNDNIKSELEAYVDGQSSDGEGESYHPHHHDDSGFYHRSVFFDVNENENGRLFRTRSDETLSQSDYSARHRKKDFYENRQAAMQHIRAWQSSERNWRREACMHKDSPIKETHLGASRHRTTVQSSPIVTQSPSKNQHESFLKNPNSDYVSYSDFLKSPPASSSGQRCHQHNPHSYQTSYTPATIDVSSPRQSPSVTIHNKSEQSRLMSPRTESHCNTIPRVSERPSQILERDQAKIKSPTETGLSSTNVYSLQCTMPRKYSESSVTFKADPDFKKQTLNISNHAITKPSQAHWAQSYKASPPSYGSNLTKQDDGHAIGRSCSQDFLVDSPSKTIPYESKSINHHQQQTLPLSHSKSHNNIPKDSTSDNNSPMHPKTSFLPYSQPIPKPVAVPERTLTPCSTNHGSFTRYTPPTKTIELNPKTFMTRPVSAGPNKLCIRSDYHNVLSSPQPANCIPPYKNPPPYHSMRPSPQGDVDKNFNDQKNKSWPKGNVDSRGIKTENPSTTKQGNNNTSNNFSDCVPSGSYMANNQVQQLTPVKLTATAGNNLKKEPLSTQPSTEKKNLSEKFGSVSLEHVHQTDVSHSKEDSSSNPDSGYSSRIYGAVNLDASNRSGSALLNSVNTSLTTPSSFSGTDQSFCGSPANLSPYHQPSDRNSAAPVDYGNQPVSNKQYFQSVTAHLQNWYHIKTQENLPKKMLVSGLQPQQQPQQPPNSYGMNSYSVSPPNQGHNYIRGSDV